MSAPVDVLAEDEDGMPVGYATWYNRHASGRVVDTSRDHDCEAAWREGAQQARAAVADLIEACKERDEAQAHYDLSEEFYGEDSNHKEMRAARGAMIRANKRYVAAVARAQGGAP